MICPRNKHQAFALPYTLFVVAFLLISGYLLVLQFMHTVKVEYAWHSLDQANLNIQNAANSFHHRQKGFQVGEHQAEFEFQADNGFAFQVVPFSVFWLGDFQGFCAEQSLRQLQVIGHNYHPEPALIMGSRLSRTKVLSNTRIEGDIQTLEEDLDPIRNHPLFAQSDFGEFPNFQESQLTTHLSAQFAPDYRAKLNAIVPSLAWLDVDSPTFDLASLSEQADLQVIHFKSGVTISGVLPSDSPPILILGERVVKLQITQEIHDMWVLSKDQVILQGSLIGSNLHFAGSSISVLGSVDAIKSSLLSVFWVQSSNKSANIGISGEGSFSGTLAAIVPPGVNGNKTGGARVSTSAGISTEGFVYCEGETNLSGPHHGAVVTRNWLLQEGGNALPGQFKNVRLKADRAATGPWGLPLGRPAAVFKWEYQ